MHLKLTSKHTYITELDLDIVSININFPAFVYTYIHTLHINTSTCMYMYTTYLPVFSCVYKRLDDIDYVLLTLPLLSISQTNCNKMRKFNFKYLRVSLGFQRFICTCSRSIDPNLTQKSIRMRVLKEYVYVFFEICIYYKTRVKS